MIKVTYTSGSNYQRYVTTQHHRECDKLYVHLTYLLFPWDTPKMKKIQAKIISITYVLLSNI